MKLITELIEFALQNNMLTEEHKRKLQDDGVYTFYFEEDKENRSPNDSEDESSESFEDSIENELDRTYYDDYYHPGKRCGKRHPVKRKSPPVGPKLTAEELNQRVQEKWKNLIEEFPRLAQLWDSWKAGKRMQYLADGFTLNDIYAVIKVELPDFHDFSGPAPTAFRQLLRQVGNSVGKYSWVIKLPETASMVEFPRFRQQILEEVKELYETDREKFAALSSQNGKLNFPFWEKAVQIDTTSMKVWTILNLTSMSVTPERIEEVQTWKPELAIAMQINLDYITDLLTKLEQRDWSSLTVITECEIENTILKSVAIPRNVKAIGVVIPEGVKVIAFEALAFCRSLTSVVIPESVTEIKWLAFEDCRSLTSVALPEGVKEIGERAFKDCSSLKSVAIPKSVTKIKYGTFAFCRSLTSVTIPEGVKEIGERSFNGCSSLKSMVIPKGVKKIKWCAFEDCSSLTSIVIPQSVRTIGIKAFENCPNLTIHAPAGSYAEKYAKRNNIPFQPLEEEE